VKFKKTTVLLFIGIGMAILFVFGTREIDISNWMGITVCAGFEFLFLSIFLYDTYKVFHCNQKIMATYTSCSTQRAMKGPDLYVPIFTYEWNGETFTASTGNGYTKRKITKKYRFGQEYPIYINPKNARIITEKRRLYFVDLICALCGIFVAILMTAVF